MFYDIEGITMASSQVHISNKCKNVTANGVARTILGVRKYRYKYN